MTTARIEVDVAVIGSGFGGSVTALRLAEKGYRVAVLEAGPRRRADDLPTTSWDVRRFLWVPWLGWRGIQRITLLRDVMVLSAAGVGGGSLNYANTLYRPPRAFYDDPQWAHLADWERELAPHYDQAERMLGATTARDDTRADDLMRRLADDLGVRHSYHPTPVGVFLGEPGVTVPDPYFGGVGPDRTGCLSCGACMTGCRHGAKNTLDRNYLHLAERLGATIHPDREVVGIERVGGDAIDEGHWVLDARDPRPWRRRHRTVVVARHVVVAAGALGTQRLLHRWRDEGRLPALSPRLGELSRTNSEAIVGARARDADPALARGVAITSSIHPDDHTHIEPVRYGPGSNALGLLSTVLVDGGGRLPRPLRFVATVLRHPVHTARSLSVRRWSERTVILLVMQSVDNSLRVVRKRGLLGARLTTTQGHGSPNPTYIPAANDAARRVAAMVGGHAESSIPEALLGIPTTAHFIGGCTIGPDPDRGVIDPYHRAFGHPGLHVVDGATVTANLGVNPSLTITAMAERAMALWPNKDEPDPRPPLGGDYAAVSPVAPMRPAVPSHAPAALRITAPRRSMDDG